MTEQQETATVSKPKILVQLDTDDHASTFDSVVAMDAGVEHLLRQAPVTPDNVREHVYGAMFTRGGDDLKRTAIFIGGSDVAAGERLLAAVRDTFFGPVRVSVMIDSGGANTTAAAAVLAAGRHLQLEGATALVLAATGPVGQRVVRLLARQGARVRVASRNVSRAEQVSASVARAVEGAMLTAHCTGSPRELKDALSGAQLVIAAGAAGVQLLPREARDTSGDLAVAIDLNAVPPVGIEGVEAADRGARHDGQICYGAIGVGAAKMKIHKAAVRSLFETNDRVLDAEEIYKIGEALSP